MTSESPSTRTHGLTLERTTPVEGGPSPAERQVLLAFAPLHKRAFGCAVGVASALLLGAVTLAALLIPGVSSFPLYLIGQYFIGYSVTWTGLLIGMGWAAFVGFVAGWFLAFCRNLAVALSVFTMRTRAELAQTRDFLDHI